MRLMRISKDYINKLYDLYVWVRARVCVIYIYNIDHIEYIVHDLYLLFVMFYDITKHPFQEVFIFTIYEI